MLEYKAENIHLNFTGLHKQFDSQELKTYPILMSDLKTNWFVSHLHYFVMVDYEFEKFRCSLEQFDWEESISW